MTKDREFEGIAKLVLERIRKVESLGREGLGGDTYMDMMQEELRELRNLMKHAGPLGPAPTKVINQCVEIGMYAFMMADEWMRAQKSSLR